jgi:hypothetical protein
VLKLQICVVVLNINISYNFVGTLNPFFKIFLARSKCISTMTNMLLWDSIYIHQIHSSRHQKIKKMVTTVLQNVVQFTSPSSLDQWIHGFFTSPHSLQLMNSLKI